MQVLATRKDDEDMLQMPVLDELLAAHRIVTENVTAISSYNGESDIPQSDQWEGR